MRTTNFNELAITDKAWLINEFGDLLMSIEYYDYRIYLYSLDHFLIELYQNIDTRQIESIQEADYSALDKYLSRIFIRRS